MTKEELIKNLENLGVSKRYYSLDGHQTTDCIVVLKNNKQFKVAYISDRGEMEAYGIFKDIEGAFQKVYDLFLFDANNSRSTLG